MDFLERLGRSYSSWDLPDREYIPVAENVFLLQIGLSNLYVITRDRTGMAYKVHHPSTMEIYPVVFGNAINRFELSRLTDLHRAKTESELLDRLYKNAWVLNLEFSVYGSSFEDYMVAVKEVFSYVRWFNSQ